RYGRHIGRLQSAEAIGGEVAGNAADAGGIATVGGDGDVEDGAGQPGILGVGLAHRCIRGQVEDAGVVVGELQFAPGAEHAVAGLAADSAGGEGEVAAGNESAGGGEDRLHAGAGIGGAADDVDDLPGAGIDLADPELVGVG